MAAVFPGRIENRSSVIAWERQQPLSHVAVCSSLVVIAALVYSNLRATFASDAEAPPAAPATALCILYEQNIHLFRAAYGEGQSWTTLRLCARARNSFIAFARSKCMFLAAEPEAQGAIGLL